MSALKNMMKKTMTLAAMSVAMSVMSVVRAGEVSTNASATGSAFGPGSAAAGASYNGNGQGYAHTDTRTGDVNFASGVAVGVDNRGICFSASNALASRFGPALASNMNICIGRDGGVSSSGGLSTASGGLTRTVSAGGFARNLPGQFVSGATVGGRTDCGGYASGRTWSNSRPPNFRWR